jgi:hypothetical protein
MTIRMTVTNWNPANAGDYITITWNREGTRLNPGRSTSATVTLTVSASVVGAGITSFSNTISFTGTS